MKRAVILVPGIMGSTLKDGDNVIWPGNPLEILFPYKHMDALLKPDLVASDVIRSVSISNQYQHLIDSLAGAGFTEGPAGNLKVFPYDWRKDNELAADLLAVCIDEFREQLGTGFFITLLAHSMGGLVCRCYLESGKYSERSGFSGIDYLITMGTPHLGAPMALAAAIGREKRLFLSADQVKTLANDPLFPSLYQLLPPRSEPFAWDREMDACFLPEDIYDSTIASALNLSHENLSSATKFHNLLNLDLKPKSVRYFFFAGTRQVTTNAIHISKDGAIRTARKIDRDDAGDGTVPTWSASQPGVQMEPVGGEHGDLYKNAGLKTVLGALLGKEGYMAASGQIPEIATREKVVYPEDQMHLTIDFPAKTSKIGGDLRFRRLINTEGTEIIDPLWENLVPISYQGPDIDHLMVIIAAPQYPGVYQVAYFRDNQQDSGVITDFFVQSST